MRMSPTIVVPGLAVLALLVLIVLAALDVRADAPDIDQQRTHGQFGVTACALVSQAALDADMTRGWYRAAGLMLRQCGRISAARIAEEKAPLARKGVFD